MPKPLNHVRVIMQTKDWARQELARLGDDAWNGPESDYPDRVIQLHGDCDRALDALWSAAASLRARQDNLKDERNG